VKRTFKTGTGITAREHVAIETAADFRRLAAAWNKALKELGAFGAAAQEAGTVCAQIVNSSKGGVEGTDSPTDFARLVAKCIRLAKAEIKRGNADEVARWAFKAGEEWQRACFKWNWEPDALRGEKVGAGLRRAAHETNAQHEQMRARRASRMSELVPKIGVDKAAATCAHEGLGTFDAIKRQWLRLRKKGTPSPLSR